MAPAPWRLRRTIQMVRQNIHHPYNQEKTLNIINLTPHAITLRAENEDNIIPASGKLARVISSINDDDPPAVVALLELDGSRYIPIYPPLAAGQIAVDGLPAPADGVVYLVSLHVLMAVQNRPDVLAPGTGPNDAPIRNESGQVVAVTRLIRSPVEATTGIGGRLSQDGK
jgi:hypothetical protein